MLIQRIQAPSVTEAMARARARLGDDACLLETRGAPGGGVEILVATERASPSSEGTDRRSRVADPDVARRVRGWLGRRGVGPRLADRLALAAATELDERALAREASVLSFARRTLSLWMPVVARPALGAGETLVLVGPPGAGKSTLLGKIAAALVRRGDAPIALVDADARRPGAAAHTRAVADALGVPVEAAEDAATIRRVRRRLAREARVLVDTAGLPRGDAGALDDVRAIAEACGQDARVEVVLAADAAPEGAHEFLRRVEALEPAAAALARCDEAVRPAALVDEIWDAIPPLWHVSHGPLVPDALSVSEPDRWAGWMLGLEGTKLNESTAREMRG